VQGETIVGINCPKTQTLDAVKSLLTYTGRPFDPLPTNVSLENGRLVLVLSSKKDAYYCTTSRTCSCPAAAYHPGRRCKHQKKHFPSVTEEEEPTARRLARSPDEAGSIRPVFDGPFKPFSELPSEERAAKVVEA